MSELSAEVMNALERLQELVLDFLVALPGVAVGIIAFIVFYILSRSFKQAVVLLVRRSRRPLYVSLLIGRLAQYGFIVFGILVSLTIALPSFQPAQLISLLGIASVAVGFAFRDILLDAVSGILLLLNTPFQTGDEIVFEEHEGTVEEIHTSFTYIVTHDNRRVIIPNGDLFTKAYVVDTAFERRRSEFDLQLAYTDDIAQAQELIQGVLQGTLGVLDKPAPDTLVMSVTTHAIIIRLRWWTYPKRANVLKVQDTILREVRTALTEAGFAQPGPHITLTAAHGKDSG
jgi:small conductance mechanosensitive channel